MAEIAFLTPARQYRAPSVILALLAALGCLCPSRVVAQLSSAAVNGVVRDTNGAVVGGATVTLKNIDTSVPRKTVSNNSGNYSFLNIPPGTLLDFRQRVRI